MPPIPPVARTTNSPPNASSEKSPSRPNSPFGFPSSRMPNLDRSAGILLPNCWVNPCRERGRWNAITLPERPPASASSMGQRKSHGSKVRGRCRGARRSGTEVLRNGRIASNPSTPPLLPHAATQNRSSPPPTKASVFRKHLPNSVEIAP